MRGKLKTQTIVVLLVLGTCLSATAQIAYDKTMTSGPFLVAPTALVVDWVVVNNGDSTAEVRVTVYELTLLGTKVEVVPGPVAFTVAPGETFHNANNVGPVFMFGRYYEIVVETTGENVHPAVNQWTCNSGACFIPDTLIKTGDFVEIKPPKVKEPK